METYLKFLLQFAIRDEEFTNSHIFIQNDYESLRVRMSPKPMIVVEVRVRKTIIVAEEKNEDDSLLGEHKRTKVIS